MVTLSILLQFMRTLYCVIVTYNGMEWIEGCLLSLQNSHYPVHTIVFDNNSSDETCNCIAHLFPEVQLIRSPVNLGFGQANNAGMKLAIAQGAEHIFLLNQDAWVNENTLSSLMQAQLTHPEFGIISPVHLNGGGSWPDINFLHYFSASAINEWVASTLIGIPAQSSLIKTSYVNAAAWLVSTACIKKTGGFDPFFFHYGEDINYCQRVLYHGYQVGIDTRVFIFHDREQRMTAGLKGKALAKREWVNLANDLCDIRQKNVASLFIKKALRYLILAVIGALTLQFKQSANQIHKLGLMLGAVAKIQRSREFAFNSRLL